MIAKPIAFESAYPGSMHECRDGNYVRRDDPHSLASALLERMAEQGRTIEDLQLRVGFDRDAIVELVTALKAVVRVADRATVEFDMAREAIAKYGEGVA